MNDLIKEVARAIALVRTPEIPPKPYRNQLDMIEQTWWLYVDDAKAAIEVVEDYYDISD